MELTIKSKFCFKFLYRPPTKAVKCMICVGFNLLEIAVCRLLLKIKLKKKKTYKQN